MARFILKFIYEQHKATFLHLKRILRPFTIKKKQQQL